MVLKECEGWLWGGCVDDLFLVMESRFALLPYAKGEKRKREKESKLSSHDTTQKFLAFHP